ncbi:MAG: chromosomal replication initiator protein DnaA [Candidatus Taylorbacteria bacterium CG10_big_fil_rev_8_21_14_0_10_41_48]|uniref:Chromosomal replication initiator protein DnaA n=1 Tax=Candidatus Taylorbacteria bacterium CG10_big_fil_rev_8_21_14_0_10_41_48 TaxID=1975024 RepID=A0A2M8LD34_9BACT|nr:MAG: chromosomal replication initiator protein DnaA [Candidatus Taylorbacteria bacterium CG10_big_fil_rev_8_21_14_0_10_41_48]
MDTKKLWETVLGGIEIQVSNANFNTWFKDTYIHKVSDGVVYLAVPNAFVRDWLANKFHKVILKSLRDVISDLRSLEYSIGKSPERRHEIEHSIEHSATPVNELPLQELYINKEDNLNPKYTFETFVVGPFNELAHAASQAVMKSPGLAYNPLFIYGDTGRGKTHLMQAVGNYIKNTHPSKKVFYVTSERFTIDYMNSLQTGKANLFKEKYRKYDVLIMDDVQFFSSKEKSQEEFFHLFNTLHENNKQLICSSDKHPNHIPDLEDRIKSRFAAGMIVDIPAPDHESRMAILKSKALLHNLALPGEIIEFLAQSVDGNIRELEGILNSISIQTVLRGRELNLIEIKNIIKNSAKPKKNISVKDVIRVVSDFYNIQENYIYEKTRKKEVVKPRQVIMYILREDLNISYPSIGEKLGGRDHTTVIHSCEKIKEDIKTNQNLVQELSHIRSLII